MKRGGPLRRRTPPRSRRNRPRRSPREHNSGYMAFVRTLPCSVTSDPEGHQGPIQAHHAGTKPGMRIKADDTTCIPVCLKHHVEVETFTGYFRGWDRAGRRAWSDLAIAETRSKARRAGVLAEEDA